MARASRAIAAQPYEGTERTIERLAEWRDGHRRSWPYEATNAGELGVHGLIGADWPCDERQRFEDVWRAAVHDVDARGLDVGRRAYGGWDDGDKRLGRVAWCLARHLRPDRIVETGVARGLTTRVLLEALELNGNGRLWSIDLPPLLERRLEHETAAAVPTRLYDRWALLRGSSRRLLRDLVSDLGQIDLFVHDSMHTTRNVSFELKHVWPVLMPGCAALIDDVEKNVAVGRFVALHPHARYVISVAGDGKALFGCLVKPRTVGLAR